ncbi:anaphase-promoting complex subunit 5-like isoform X1 [Raphanus sativus]|nr:anaphase-promoting complex subunit 5-like isoform X1 [Raphanus sativus]
MRGIFGSLDSGAVLDDQIVLVPNSNLGVFVRRCILAFNLLSFELVQGLRDLTLFLLPLVVACMEGKLQMSFQALEYHELAAEALYLMAMVYDKLGRREESGEPSRRGTKHCMRICGHS